MSSNSSWVPDESTQTPISERCWFQGAIIGAMAYGATVSLYFMSFNLLIRRISRKVGGLNLSLLIYITVSFLLGTLFAISSAAFTQVAFIDDRNYPGGPNAFTNNMFSIHADELGNSAFVLSTWLSDALVVWRFKVIYQSCRLPLWSVMPFPCLMFAGSVGQYLLGNSAFVLSTWLSDALVVWRFKVIYQSCQLPLWSVMLFPCLMFTGSVAMGIMFLIQISTTNPYVSEGVNFTLPFLSLSLALNIILTISIVLRLLRFRYRVVSVLGPTHGTQYTSIAAMIIESAALYSCISVTFLVLFGINNPVSQVFLQSLSQFQAIATLLIVFRVAQGKGWTGETAARMMTTQRSEPAVELGVARYTLPGASITLASSKEVVKKGSGTFQDELHVQISTESSVMRDVA